MRPLPYDVRGYLREVRGIVRGALGSPLVGLYTTGSLALEDFRPNRSDIDLIAVVDGPVPADALRCLARLLEHCATPCPAAGLELVVHRRAAVAAASVEAGYLLNLNTGAALRPMVSLDPREQPGFWFAIDRAVTHQSGAAIIGPGARAVFAPLAFADLLPVVIASVEAHAASGVEHLRDNAVLNGCRALCFARDRRWYSKLAAARRSLPTAGPHAALLCSAVRTYEQGRGLADGPSPAAVRDYLDHVLTSLRAG